MLFRFTTLIRLTFSLLSTLLIIENTYGVPLSLNGIANYRVLNQDYYIAALYLAKPLKSSSVQEILSSTQSKQMKLLVNAPRWSPRLWQKQWQSDLDINNPNATEALLDQLTTFTQLLKAELVSGDLVTFNYQENIGTQIHINEQLMQSTQNIELFNALLTTWIGKLPPSRYFKKNILSLNNDQITQVNMQTLYTANLSDERKMDILKWNYSDSQISNMAHQKQNNAQKILALKSRVQARHQARDTRQKQKALQAQKLAAQEKVLQEQKKIQSIEKQTRLAKQALLLKERSQRKSLKEKTYYKDLYHWKLYTAIRKNIQYPQWAREFNQEGLVKATFTIDNHGKVIQTQFNKEEVSNFLIVEVERSIQAISGKLPPPKALDGKQWKFALSHNFSFRSKKQNAVKQPIKPSHL